jgi:phage baseplate assembly protein gpV
MISLIRSEISRALQRRTYLAFAEVVRVDWSRQLAKVRLSTTGQESGWLRIAASAAGAVRPLRRGDEVKVSFLDGNPAGAGVVECVLYGAARVPDLPENSFGARQGQAKILFDAQGNVIWQSVSTVSISSTSSISLDGSQVKLAGGASSAVTYEALEAAFNAWALQLIASFEVAAPPIKVVILPPVLTAARSIKVRLT